MTSSPGGAAGAATPAPRPTAGTAAAAGQPTRHGTSTAAPPVPVGTPGLPGGVPQASGTGLPATGAAAAPQQGSRMPSDLRRLRAAAPIACALTGVAASGLLGITGYEPTASSVVEQQRQIAAAQQELHRADLAAGRIVAERALRPDTPTAELDAARSAYDRATAAAAERLVSAAGAAQAPAELTTAIRGLTSYTQLMERALVAPAASATNAADSYRQLREVASTEVLNPLSAASTTNLERLRDGGGAAGRPGGRILVLLVGGLSTAGLVAASWWLARKTHRIINPALASAAVITAGLTFLAVNPQLAIGANANNAVETARSYQSLATQVYDARRAELTGLLPGTDADAAQATWKRNSDEIDVAIGADLLNRPERQTQLPVAAVQAWENYQRAHTRLLAAGGAQERIGQLRAGDRELGVVLDATETANRGAADGLNDAVGRPALIGSASALAAGALAAALAWIGIGRRLEEYR